MENAPNLNTVTRWFEKNCLGCKNFNKKATSDQPKTMDSESRAPNQFGWVLWHINHCRLFNAKSSLY